MKHFLYQFTICKGTIERSIDFLTKGDLLHNVYSSLKLNILLNLLEIIFFLTENEKKTGKNQIMLIYWKRSSTVNSSRPIPDGF